MEANQIEQQNFVNQIYNQAADLLLNQDKTEGEVVKTLISQGLDEETARRIVDKVSDQINDAKKERANKDMLYGALWCVGGIIATVSGIGFIFYGAIIFGGIQFFKGLMNS